jgi:membrane-associated protease RseP (regulator of RpoE activity)
MSADGMKVTINGVTTTFRPASQPGGGSMVINLPEGMEEAMAGMMEKVTFLGVSARPMPPVLQKHLKLPRGVGLVVLAVVPDSPAAQAGVEADDVLQKLDDQLLINPPQLMTLVRMYKPGDTVKLTVIHEGTAKVVSAKLIEKQVPKAEMMEGRERGEMMEGRERGEMMRPPGLPFGGGMRVAPGGPGWWQPGMRGCMGRPGPGARPMPGTPIRPMPGVRPGAQPRVEQEEDDDD